MEICHINAMYLRYESFVNETLCSIRKKSVHNINWLYYLFLTFFKILFVFIKLCCIILSDYNYDWYRDPCGPYLSQCDEVCKRMDMVKIDKLSFEYIRRDEDGNVESVNTAIDNVSLDVKKGDFIAILGANGSGKSTLAKHINAILYPTQGSVWVNGLNTSVEDNIWAIRQNAGMVFQNPDNQIIATVVEEDVGFGPENLGIPTDEIWERVDKSLKAVGMLEYRNASPNKLSGGQKQRVAIAGIMAMKPQCIVLDEPTAMLDPNGRKEVIATVRELNQKENVTVMLITHHMDEVTYADKVFVMNQGHLVMEGTPREIFSKVDEIKKYRLDVPQVTELAYELKKSGVPIPDGILSVEELITAIEAL